MYVSVTYLFHSLSRFIKHKMIYFHVSVTFWLNLLGARRKQTVATVAMSKLSSTSTRAAKSRPTTRSDRTEIIYTFTVDSAQLAKILLTQTDNCSDWGSFKVYVLEEVVCLWLLVTIVSKNCLHCMHRCHMQLRILPLPLRNQQ